MVLAELFEPISRGGSPTWAERVADRVPVGYDGSLLAGHAPLDDAPSD
jgi:hypothetical protein